MTTARADIIQKLQREILALGGISSVPQGAGIPAGPSFWKEHFPNGSLPLAAMHEFISHTQEDHAASSGFIAALMSNCLPKHGAIVWVSPEPLIFPPALCSFNMLPQEVIFIHPANEKDLLWVTEEALKCAGLRAVIAETRNLPAMAARRYQLAVEKSKVTGFLVNRTKGDPITNNCVSRWKVNTAPSHTVEGIPGIGQPRWHVDLQKIRNGKPGQWTMEWSGQELHAVNLEAKMPQERRMHRLTG